jgi:hypothetical protein
MNDTFLHTTYPNQTNLKILEIHNCNIASIIKCHQYLKPHPIDATGGSGGWYDTPKGKKLIIQNNK